jgi:macrodomain Ter protein organizer (MatP/YcbG family)
LFNKNKRYIQSERGDRLAREEKEKVLKAVRINPDTWQKALGKARSRGLTMEELIDKLLRLYNANRANVKGGK